MASDRPRWEDENSRFAVGFNVTHGDVGEAQRARINEGLEKANKTLIAIEKASRKKLATTEDGTEVFDASDGEVRTILREEARDYAVKNGFYEVNQNLEGLQAGIDESNQTASVNSEHLAELNYTAYEIRDALFQSNATGDAILEGVGAIEANTEEIISSLDRVNDGLDTLVDLAMDSIKEQKKTRKTITALFGQMLVFLESSKGQFLTHLKRIQYHQLATRNILADIAEIGLETNRKLDRNMRDQRQIAENVETYKVRHYCNDGKKLIRMGHLEEALISLNDAYSHGRTDFETNYLLAQVYAARGEEAKSKKHLALAEDFAVTEIQKSAFAELIAEKHRIEGNAEALTNHVLRTLHSNPVLYLSPVWRGIMAKAKIEEKIIKDICRNNNNDLDKQAVCLLWLMDNNWDKNLIPDFVDHVAHPALSKELQSALLKGAIGNPSIKNEISRLIDRNISNMPSSLVLTWARQFLESGDLIPRRWIAHIYCHDAKIREMQKSHDYSGIAGYFKSALGDKVARLKNFGDLPERIRKLL